MRKRELQYGDVKVYKKIQVPIGHHKVGESTNIEVVVENETSDGRENFFGLVSIIVEDLVKDPLYGPVELEGCDSPERAARKLASGKDDYDKLYPFVWHFVFPQKARSKCEQINPDKICNTAGLDPVEQLRFLIAYYEAVIK